MLIRLSTALILLAGALAWKYHAIWATDPLSIPASNDGWGATSSTNQPAAAKLQTATFAAGCFWSVEATFRKIPGVVRTRVGYTGGSLIHPTYLDVASQTSGHAEAIDIEFDPAQVSYTHLLETFFAAHDPTASDRSEYRSAIFYHTPEQLADAQKEMLNQSTQYTKPITTELTAAGPFYPAEEYHQRYYERNGAVAICHVKK